MVPLAGGSPAAEAEAVRPRPFLTSMDASPVNSFWTARAQALARAQDRYLLLLALAGLFYYALDIRVSSSHESPTSLRLPLVDIELSALIIWAAAPIVLGFLLLSVVGVFHALRDAHAHLRSSSSAGVSGDTPSTTPDITFNILDAVVYTSPSSPKLLKRLLSFTYPLFLTVFWIEAAVFLVEILARPASDIFATNDYLFWQRFSANIFRILGFIFVLAPVPGLHTLWRSRLGSR